MDCRVVKTTNMITCKHVKTCQNMSKHGIQFIV